MATTATNVTAGKPMVGGAVHWAPTGTAIPTDASAALAEAFVDMGYISEDGVTNSDERESEEIKDWGGNTVLTLQTGKTDTFGMTFIEALNVDVLKRIYGSDNVSGTLATGITVRANADELETGVWVIDMIMTEGAKKRIVIPAGKITETEEITYASGEAVGYGVTITAFPGSDGDSHKEYIIRA